MNALIPVYHADGSLYAWASEQRLARLQSAGLGTRYSFKELLEHGPAWELKHLDGSHGGKTYAPPETRAVFRQVVEDCTVP